MCEKYGPCINIILIEHNYSYKFLLIVFGVKNLMKDIFVKKLHFIYIEKSFKLPYQKNKA